jgi:hypothetical protein
MDKVMLADEFGVTEHHGTADDLEGPHTSSYMNGAWQQVMVLRS